MTRKQDQDLRDLLRMEMLNERLNVSEQLLVKKIGRRRVNALIRSFKAQADDEPGLWRQLYAQPDPYNWLHERSRHMN